MDQASVGDSRNKLSQETADSGEFALQQPSSLTYADTGLFQQAAARVVINPDGSQQITGRAGYGVSGDIPTPQGNTVIFTPNQSRPDAQVVPNQFNPNPAPQYIDQTNPGRWQPAPDQLPGAQAPGAGTTQFWRQHDANAPQATSQPRQGEAQPAPTDKQVQIALNSLHGSFSMQNYLMAGMAGGVIGSGPLPWALDKTFGLKGGGPVGDIWRQHYSPLQMEMATSRQKLAKLTTSRQEAVDNMKTALWLKPTDDSSLIKVPGEGGEPAKPTVREQLQESRNQLQSMLDSTLELKNRSSIIPGAGDTPHSHFSDTDHVMGLDPKIAGLKDAITEADNLKEAMNPDRLNAAFASHKPGEALDEKLWGNLERTFTKLPEHSLIDKVTNRETPEKEPEGIPLYSANEKAILRRYDDLKVNTISPAFDRAHMQLGAFSSYNDTIGKTELALERISRPGSKANTLTGFSFSHPVEYRSVNDSHAVEHPMGLPFMTEQARKASEPLTAWTKGWKGYELPHRMGAGLTAALGGLAVDAAIDSPFGYNHFPSQSNFYRSLEGPAVAASLLLPGINPYVRTMMVVGSLAAPAAMDAFVAPPTDARYSQLMKPNWVEAAGMGAGWMMPFRAAAEHSGPPLARLGAVTAGWALGKLANAATMAAGTDFLGLGNPDAGPALYDNTTASVEAFERSQSTSKFKNIVETSYNLAMENEAALGVAFQGLHKNHAQDINSPSVLEADAALLTGGGDMWVKRGSKISTKDPNSYNDQGRILAGFDIDLGGQGLSQYRLAAAKLDLAAQSLTHNGAPPSDVQRVNEERQIVQERLDKIYGPHDIGGVYNKLVDSFGSSMTQDRAFTFAKALRDQVRGLNTNDNQYKAKLCRDLALFDLAQATFNIQSHMGAQNGLDAKAYYQEAAQLVAAAQSIAPGADGQAIDSIARYVGTQVQPAIDNQINNQVLNPFDQQSNNINDIRGMIRH